MNNYDYPLGADNNSAPWNEKELPSIKIPVTVSITLSKQFEIEVNDYELTEEWDDDFGTYFKPNYKNCDLKQAVENQIYLPHILGVLFKKKKIAEKFNTYTEKKIIKDLSDWCVDDFEVIKD